MDLSRIIIGPVVTEKSERQKLDAKRTYTLVVAPDATKVSVKAALKRYFDVDVTTVRVMRVGPKYRLIATGFMQKRHAYKKMLVTLAPKSKPLDLAAFQTVS